LVTSGKELNIVIIDESPVRAAILEDGLREAGYTRVTLVSKMTQLARRVYSLDPDVILIDLENPRRDGRADLRPPGGFLEAFLRDVRGRGGVGGLTGVSARVAGQTARPSNAAVARASRACACP